MSSIFVSYRRSDSSTIVGRIIDHLEHRFGKESIFRDLDNIDFGDEFGIEIKSALKRTDVLLAIIGNDWVSVMDEEGQRRLEDPKDWVRLEVSNALENGIHVIPVLVEDTTMPSIEQLPGNLKPLVERHAAKVRADPDFDSDIKRLFESIEKQLNKKTVSSRFQTRKSKLLVAIGFIFTLSVLPLLYGRFGDEMRLKEACNVGLAVVPYEMTQEAYDRSSRCRVHKTFTWNAVDGHFFLNAASPYQISQRYGTFYKLAGTSPHPDDVLKNGVSQMLSSISVIAHADGGSGTRSKTCGTTVTLNLKQYPLACAKHLVKGNK